MKGLQGLRRTALLAATTVALVAGSMAVGHAQDKFPTRPVTVIIPLSAGGAIDVFARALGKAFEQSTGQGFVIENRPGANTIVAANACKSAKPDGYTICLLTRSTISLNPALYKKLSYGLSDFEPVTNLFFGQQVIILSKAVPVTTFAEFVEYSKKNPDKLNFGSFGIGGDSHLLIEWLKQKTGAKITHIPYKGASPALLAFKRGDVQLITLLIGNPDIIRQIKSGEITGLLTPGAKRSPLIPTVPTFAEAKLSDDETAYLPWFGMFAPKGTPQAIVDKLSTEISAILKTKSFVERYMTPQGFTPVGNTPAQFAKFLANDRDVAANLVAVSGVKLDK